MFSIIYNIQLLILYRSNKIKPGLNSSVVKFYTQTEHSGQHKFCYDTAQVAQARNKSVGEHRHCCVTYLVCDKKPIVSVTYEKERISIKNSSIIDPSRKYHHNLPYKCSLFKTPKFCISIVFSFPWDHFNSQEKLKTMLLQNFGVTNKEHCGMLWYFLEWSILHKILSLIH